MNIAFIGCGNMASSIAIELKSYSSSLGDTLSFFTYTPSKTRALKLADKIGGVFIENFSDFAAYEIDYWILGFKPQQLASFLETDGKLLKGKNIVSMLAAVDINKLEEAFSSQNIIRIMPNTPIKIGLGTTLLYKSNQCNSSFEQNVVDHFSSAGIINCASEKDLDVLTTFSGCGPAYLFLFADTMLQKMLELGFEKETSRKLLNSLFVGSSKLMQNSNLDLSILLDQVTSKGGVTIEAVKSYRASDLYGLTSKAIDAAIKRTDEMNRL
jgi:pyrroline-5-carboxylate reductase